MKDDEAKVHEAGCDHYIMQLYGRAQAVLVGASYRLLRRVLGRDRGSETKPPVIMQNATDWQSTAILRRS